MPIIVSQMWSFWTLMDQLYFIIEKSIAKHWFCQFFLDILFHYKTFTHTFFNCKKKSLAKDWWLYFINFSLTFYSITRHLHIHYLIEKKNPLQNIDDYLFQFFLVILFPYKTFPHILFNCKKNPLQKIDDYLFPCNFIPLQSIYTNII